MKEVYEYLINNMKNGKIDKKYTFDLIRLLKKSGSINSQQSKDIAIIGMAVRIPNARTVDEYWDLIANKVDCISEFPSSRKEDICGYLDYMNSSNNENHKVKFFQSAYLDAIDKFDYKYFNLTPREASIMDPAQRIFLEVAWHAIEDAGYGGEKLFGTNTGVYVGFAGNVKDLYARLISDINPNLLSLSMTGNLSAVIPSRLSYILDLKGPSMVVDTACSSSMVSLDLACQALINGKCDCAIVGGINIDILPIDEAYTHIGIESSDHRSRAFDDNSDGSGIGEGVITLILKPLQNAYDDKDHIYAIIKGSAVNQDGYSSGLSAPNPAAQTAVLKKSWENAGINPSTISYIETHGTATNLGDPIEVKGIYDAFRSYTEKMQFCAISSVKTNIGHLCEASGLASVVKAIIALNKKQLPPSLYFNKPNAAIPFVHSPVYVNTQLRPWPSNGEEPRRCGISSFGISGTNSHVVLEEVPYQQSRHLPEIMPYQILCLSARTEIGLNALVLNYLSFLQDNANLCMQDICYSANTGRGHYEYRLAIIATSLSDLSYKLRVFMTGQADIDECIFIAVCDSRSHTANKSKSDAVMFDKLSSIALQDIGYLKELCAQYVAGETISWECLYKDCCKQKVSVPVYPFEAMRCWIDLPKKANSQLDDLTAMYHRPCWIEKDMEKVANIKDGIIVLFIDKETDAFTQDMISLLHQKKQEVIIVQLGDQYEKNSDNYYVINNQEKDYDQLFSNFIGKKINYMIHLFTLKIKKAADSYDDLKLNLESGALSLFYLIKAIVNYGFEQESYLLLLSKYVHKILDNDDVIPENATLFGLSKVLHLELPGVFCRGVDIDNDTPAQVVWNELGSMHSERQVAYRNQKRYIEGFTAFDLEAQEDNPVNIESGKVYLIAGGMGGIGLEVAKYLASKAAVKIIMIGRTKLPPKEQWDQSEYFGTYENKIQRCIRSIRQIEASGSSATCYYADICDFDKMKRIIEEVRQRYGDIRGVFNCAGIASGSVLIRRKLSEVYEVISPKIFGTWILDHLVPSECLDFFILFSSGQSILSEPGNGDYTAANSYLDAFAEHRNAQGKTALAIDWVSWRETGMSVVHGFNKDTIFKALSTSEALHGLEKAMNKKVSRLLIGQFNCNPEYLYMLDWATFQLPDAISTYVTRNKMKKRDKEITIIKNVKIELKGKKSFEITDVEKKIANIYFQVLGIEEININDSFFELGGDSIMLNYMYTLINNEFPNRIKLIDVFTYTSIASMSEFINRGTQQKVNKVLKKDCTTIDDYLSIFEDIKSGEINFEDAVKTIIEK